MGAQDSELDAEMVAVNAMRASEIKKKLTEMSIGTSGVFEVCVSAILACPLCILEIAHDPSCVFMGASATTLLHGLARERLGGGSATEGMVLVVELPHYSLFSPNSSCAA